MSKGKSIRLYNVFREVGSEYHLSVDELYLYSVLRRLINYSSETLVTIDLLDKYTRQYSDIQFHSRKGESRPIIKNLLLSLIEKGVIETDESLTSKSNQLFKITFSEMSKLGGYESIHFSKFDSVTDKTMFYIYFVVASWKGNGVFLSSYNRWAEILDMTPTTAKKYVDSAVDKEVIYCNVGDYSDGEIRSGQKTRNPNQYSIYPFEEEEKSNMQRKQDKEEKSTPVTIGDDWGESSKYPFDTGNWVNKNNLDVDDYVIYIERKRKDDHVSKDFVAECDKKRKRIMNGNDKFKHIDKKNMELAKDKIVEREQQKKEDLAEQQKQTKIDKIKDGQIVVVRDNEDVYLDSINDVQINDELYRVQVMDSPFDGDSDYLSEHSIFNIVTKENQDYEVYHSYSDDVLSQLLDKFREVYSNYDEFDVYNIGLELEKFRNELLETYNENKEYDEVWEEDIISLDDGRNITLQQRINEYESKVKRIDLTQS
ncbi:hypothetical protein [Lentibacillus amyloliquefaciens]|uniref:Uncharacterized protein n=1 Tax=Lentibacillus amyloliquefaciens TaxID=1472767 RepID=A0A0U4F2R3_9BACI|nr:hypothetical protein [Lentibacillus amyloliquefaciens]ALX47862.1 hypothetical protein AOX59_04135 [Lentibacillus amyloliquefaciens]